MSTWWHTSHWTCPRPQLHSGEKLHFTLAMWLVLSAKSAKFGLKVPAHTNWNTCSHKHSLILMCWCGVFQGFPAGQFRIWRICGLGPAGWVWLDHTTAGLCYGQSVLVAVVSLCWGFGCYGQFVLESWCYDQFNNNNDSNNVFFYVPFLLLSTRPIAWNKISADKKCIRVAYIWLMNAVQFTAISLHLLLITTITIIIIISVLWIVHDVCG